MMSDVLGTLGGAVKERGQGREMGGGSTGVNRWDGGFDGLKRIREASGNKRGSWK